MDPAKPNSTAMNGFEKVGSQKSGVRSRESEVGSRESEVESRKSEDGSRKTEDGSRKMKDVRIIQVWDLALFSDNL